MAEDPADPGPTESVGSTEPSDTLPGLFVGGDPPSYLRLGGKRTPPEVREDTRRQLALILAVLVFLIALLLVAFTATDLLSGGETKDLAAAVLSPVVAVTGTALGFYFGGHRSGDQ